MVVQDDSVNKARLVNNLKTERCEKKSPQVENIVALKREFSLLYELLKREKIRKLQKL